MLHLRCFCCSCNANWYGSKWNFMCFMGWWRMIRSKHFITIQKSEQSDGQNNFTNKSLNKKDFKNFHTCCHFSNRTKYRITSTDKKYNTKPTRAEKAVKQRDCTQMPMAKKERTDHKCLWQRKKDKLQILVPNEKWLP